MLTKECKKLLHADRQKWADEMTQEGEMIALERGQNRDAFSNFRNLRTACISSTAPILDENGQLISDKVQKWNVWENFKSNLLNRPQAAVSVEFVNAARRAIPEPTTICDPPI